MVNQSRVYNIPGISWPSINATADQMLAIYTMSAASAVTVGGILYDTAGWQGMSIFHLILQAPWSHTRARWLRMCRCVIVHPPLLSFARQVQD